MADNDPSGGGIISVLQNGVKALNAIGQGIKTIFPQTSGTATSAVAGAATLPSNPVGFMVVTLPNGTSAKVPYYS